MQKRLTRNEFLQVSAGALASVILSRGSCKKNTIRKPDRIGLQLYSVRDVFEKDPAGTIRQLAGMGYRQLESYERNDDFFWGLSPAGFKTLMDELGMSLVSAHCEIEKDFERKAEQAAASGMKYLIHNWPFNQQPMEEYKKKAELYNRCGEISIRAGIRFGYHNYSSSYQLVDGIYPQDILMDRTEASLVDHQMDLYWVWRAGQDPGAWLKKYPKRYKLAHVKDGNDKETCLLGKGRLDLESILSIASNIGIEYFIVEQEEYRGLSSMESAKKNLDYLNNLFD